MTQAWGLQLDFGGLPYLWGEASGAALTGVAGLEDPDIETPAVEDGAVPAAVTRTRVELPLGSRGCVVIAVSGFSKCSWSGPSPNRINARESGTLLFCQPWSA